MGVVFQTIIKSRGLTECTKPIWKLKISDSEYEDLRAVIAKQINISSPDISNPFFTVCKEATLFFAEYWHREYAGGNRTKEMVFKALGTRKNNPELVQRLYEAAMKGCKFMEVENYDDGKTNQLDNMLFQGGLPMKLITKNITNSVYNHFVRGLLNHRIGIEELNLGNDALHSNSIRQYCSQLAHAAEAGDYTQMPFHCENEFNGWFVYLNELAKQERETNSESAPFTLEWNFNVDSERKTIDAEFVVRGMQKLPLQFLIDEKLLKLPFFPVQVKANGKIVSTFDYEKHFCRQSVVCRSAYTMGEVISVVINDQKEPIINRGMNINAPQILFQNNDGTFTAGNKIGSQKCLIIIPEGWNVKDEDTFTTEEYSISGTKVNVVSLDADFNGRVEVCSSDDSVTFSSNTPLFWTEQTPRQIYLPEVVEPLYNANDCRYSLCTNVGGIVKKQKINNVQFRNASSKDWRILPSLGEILARVKEPNGNFVYPARMINVGGDIAFGIIEASAESCKIKLTWEHGEIATEDGNLIDEGTWEFEKKDDRNIAKFTLTPYDTEIPFGISVRLPFVGFSIVDAEGNIVENGGTIAYADIDRYQYHIVGESVSQYTFGNICRKVEWNDNRLYIQENDQKQKSAPFEGCLTSLFGHRERVKSLLKEAGNALEVVFTLANDETFSININTQAVAVKTVEPEIDTEAENAISEELDEATMGDDLWMSIIAQFNKSIRENISPNSSVALRCVAREPKHLMNLAFQLFALCSTNDEREILTEQLRAFAGELSFNWNIIGSQIDTIMMTLNNFVGDLEKPFLKNVYTKWAMSREEKKMTYLSALNSSKAYNDYIGQCLMDIITSFTGWVKELVD